MAKVDISEQAYSYFGDRDIPAGMRNFNPGNIKAGENWEGVLGESFNTDEGDPQAVFADPLAGMRAAGVLAMNKQNIHGLNTVEKLIADQKNGWTPGNPKAADNIAASMGIAKTDPINLNDPKTLQSFLTGLITQEHGLKGALFGKETINRGAIQAVIAKAVSPDFVRSAIQSVPKGEPIPVSAALRGSQPATQVAAATPTVAPSPRANPLTAFMSAITPPATPSVIDRVFPAAPIPAGGPRRDFQVPAFMQGAVTGIGNAVKGAAGAVRDAAIGVRDAAFPGIADRAAWQDGTLDPIDVAAPYERNYGSKTAKDPKAATMDAVKAAVSSYFGPGYTVNAYSGTRPGSEKPGHRPDKSGFGAAIDFYVDGPKGRVTDEKQLHGVIGKLAEMNPTASIGFNKAYMGAGIHFALDNRAEYWGRNSTKHPDKKGRPSVTPEFVQAVLGGRARAADKAVNPQKYGGIPSIAPRGGLVTAQELAAERQKMVDAYAPYQQSPVPRAAPVVAGTARAGFGKSGSARGALSPAAALAGQYGLYQRGLGINPGALMMDRPAAPAAPTGFTGGGGGWTVPSQKGGLFGVVGLPNPGRQYVDYLYERGMLPGGPKFDGVKAPPSRSISAPSRTPAQSVGRKDYESQAKAFDRLVTSAGIPSLPSRQRTDGSMRFSPGRPAAQSVGRQSYVSPAKERERLVTSAGIPSLPAQPREATMSVPSRAPAKESVGRQNYVSPARERERLVTSAGIPSLPTVSRETSRALPSAPVVGVGPADFRQSPAEARAQQLNEMHDKIVRDNPLPQRNLSKAEMVTAYGAYGNRAPSPIAPSGIAMAADSVLNRQAAPASIAGVRAAPAAGPTRAAPNSWADQVAAAKAKDPVGIPMQADKYLAQTVISNLPGLAAAARSAVPTIQRTIEKATAPRQAAPAVGPTTGAAQTGRLNYAEPKLIAPAPAAPSGNPNVVSTPTQGGGVRSVDTQTGWSSYTNPNTGVTTTFTPDGTPVGGGQGMVGGGGGGPGGK